MTYGATLVDTNGVPISSVLSQNNTGQTNGGNVTPVPLMGHPGSFLDSSQSPMTSVLMGYMYGQIVQSGHSVTGSGGKTLTFTFTNNNNQGNSIVVCMGMGEVEGAGITLTVTDSPAGGASNTYTQQVKAPQSTTLESAIFLATGIKAGANTVTVTIAGGSSSNTAISMECYEVWGPIALASALDQTNTGSAGSGTAVTTGAVVPTVPNELAFMAVAAAGGTITAGTGWTSDTGGALSPTGGGLVSFESQSQLLTTFSSVTPSATLGTSNAWAACCATFKSIIVPVQGSFNLFQVGGALIALGSKTSANSFPVVIASDQGAVPVSESGTWTVQPGNTPNTSAWLTQNVVASSNGSVPYHNLSGASTNSTNVKGAAAQMYGYAISNTNAAARYVKFYDKATAPTIGTDTPKHTIEIPANGVVMRAIPEGMHFANGFGWGTTTGVADSDTGAVGSNDLVVDFSLNS